MELKLDSDPILFPIWNGSNWLGPMRMMKLFDDSNKFVNLDDTLEKCYKEIRAPNGHLVPVDISRPILSSNIGFDGTDAVEFSTPREIVTELPDERCIVSCTERPIRDNDENIHTYRAIDTMKASGKLVPFDYGIYGFVKVGNVAWIDPSRKTDMKIAKILHQHAIDKQNALCTML